jgi:fatty acid desaturase
VQGYLGPVHYHLEEQGRRGALSQKEGAMAERRESSAGISLGGIIVVAGIVVMIFWSFWIGLIVTLIGLIAFGGFARGKWY